MKYLLITLTIFADLGRIAASQRNDDILSGLSGRFLDQVRSRSIVDHPDHRHLSSGKKSSSTKSCKKALTVFLDQSLVDANQYSEVQGGVPQVFDRQGGVIPIGDADADDPAVIVGDYSYLITFTTPAFGCVANGAYTLDDGKDQITFTASCSGLPFFTVTGGRGKYEGADGFVQFMIPVEGGNNHEIYLC